jgi:hypothetical protein
MQIYSDPKKQYELLAGKVQAEYGTRRRSAQPIAAIRLACADDLGLLGQK